jgi:hypothetical protein
MNLQCLIVLAAVLQASALLKSSPMRSIKYDVASKIISPTRANTERTMSLSTVLPVIQAFPFKAVFAAPVMYSLMSMNEYITHRYYQHTEFNRNEVLKSMARMFTRIEQPKVKGGGHVEHHAETYDDMTLKTDDRWMQTPAAKSLNADPYRGTAFSWSVLGLMTVQMLPTAVPVFLLMGFSLAHTFAMLVPSLLLHGLVWNAIHPPMHGLPKVPASFGPPSNVLDRFNNTPLFKYLHTNHVGHHVAGGQGNYNVCCPLTDHILGTHIDEAVWKKQVRPKPAYAQTKTDTTFVST